MEYSPLSFEVLLGYLRTAIEGIPDPRKPSNSKRYTLVDMVLGAFSTFFMQSESFLCSQRQQKLGKVTYSHTAVLDDSPPRRVPRSANSS